MPAFQDQAVCLRSRDYSESSQIVTLFSREHGKISAIAKGSRRLRKGVPATIELLCPAEVMIAPPRGEAHLGTLQSFDISETMMHLRKSLLGLHAAELAADLLDQFTEDMDPHEELYDLFVAALRQFGTLDRDDAVLLKFELELLQEVGLMPQWDVCCHCREPLPEDQRRCTFSSQSGGVVCRNCEKALVEKRFLSRDALAVLRREKKMLASSPKIIFEAHELLSYYQREQLGKQTKTMMFVNQLLQQQMIKNNS